MIQITPFAWVFAIFSAITFLPLMFAQLIMITNPNGKTTKELIIGRGKNWRDHSHFKYSLAFAWADWLIVFPLLVLGNIGVLMGEQWGYVLWLILGILSIYFSIVFWVLEHKHALQSNSVLAYYTYIWGFFLYWGIGVCIFSGIIILA